MLLLLIVEYKFDERDFSTVRKRRKIYGSLHSCIESATVLEQRCHCSTKMQKKKTQRALDEKMEDGINLFDLELNMLEGQVSRDLFDEIFTDLTKELNKPKN